MNIPPWHPFAVCLLAVQQASQQPRAAIKRDQEESDYLGPKFVQEKYRFTKPYFPWHPQKQNTGIQLNIVCNWFSYWTYIYCSGKLNYAWNLSGTRTILAEDIVSNIYRTIRLMFKNICVNQCEGIQALCWSKFSQITQYSDSAFYFLRPVTSN